MIDGHNLMPLLQGHVRRSEHEFLFHYCGEVVWKVHYVTPVFQPPGAQACYQSVFCQCSGQRVTHHDPSLLFDLTRDPSEFTPLTHDAEPLYDTVIETVASTLKEHKKTILPVQEQPSELNRNNIWLKPCCGVVPCCLCDKEGGRLS